MAREPNRAGAAAIGENEYNTMRISELRRIAHKRGLDVDGSREMLIAALKEAPWGKGLFDSVEVCFKIGT